MPEEPLEPVKKLFQQYNSIAIWENIENRETCDYGVPSRFLQRSRVLEYTVQLMFSMV